MSAVRFQLSSNPDKVVEVAEKVLKLDNLNKKTEIRALFYLANAYSGKRNYKKALQYSLQGEKIAGENHYIDRQIGGLNIIIQQYEQLRMYDRALSYLNKADDLAESYPQRDSIRKLIGNNYYLRGMIYRHQFNNELAIKFLKKAVAEYKTEPNDLQMVANQCIAMDNVGFCYLDQGKIDSAQVIFSKTIILGKKINNNNSLGYTYLGLAQANILINKTNEAEYNLNTALLLSKELGDPNLSKDLYKWLSYNSIAKNDLESYHEYLKRYVDADNDIQKFEKDFMNNIIFESDKRSTEKTRINSQSFYIKISTLLILHILAIYYLFL
ncbi:tetratricopeptide repeat protein [Chryseobacterium sp. 3008163]|nr:tetratricopeptide repeat protein [Chryseobacterium sp. 3008163]